MSLEAGADLTERLLPAQRLPRGWQASRKALPVIYELVVNLAPYPLQIHRLALTVGDFLQSVGLSATFFALSRSFLR